MDIARNATIGAVTFFALDALWLGLLMNGVYRRALQPIARLSESGFEPVWPAAAIVWVLLGIGIALFAVPRAESVAGAAMWGAALGFVVYGVYDFTNYSTLSAFPLSIVWVDLAWGSVASAVTASVVYWSQPL